jgi:very-short-patch-repair endonuclease
MRREQPWSTNRSRALRANETSAEDRVWQAIRNRQLGGFKFVRQLPIGPYFADFACREKKVIIEIDGVTHGTEAEMAKDAARTMILSEMGFRVFRACNSDIYENLMGVLDALLGEGVNAPFSSMPKPLRDRGDGAGLLKIRLYPCRKLLTNSTPV